MCTLLDSFRPVKWGGLRSFMCLEFGREYSKGTRTQFYQGETPWREAVRPATCRLTKTTQKFPLVKERDTNMSTRHLRRHPRCPINHGTNTLRSASALESGGGLLIGRAPRARSAQLPPLPPCARSAPSNGELRRDLRLAVRPTTFFLRGGSIAAASYLRFTLRRPLIY